MNRQVLYIAIALALGALSPLSGQENYILTQTFLDSLGRRSVSEYRYFDGFGRPSGTAVQGVTADGGYLHGLQEYDGNLVEYSQGRWSEKTPDIVKTIGSVLLKYEHELSFMSIRI